MDLPEPDDILQVRMERNKVFILRKNLWISIFIRRNNRMHITFALNYFLVPQFLVFMFYPTNLLFCKK